MNARDMREFADYLKQCTDKQVIGVLEREHNAGRGEYELLARLEAENRGFLDPYGEIENLD